jgi:hypothetical protein
MSAPSFPKNWYWTVAGDPTQVYATNEVGDYVPVANTTYQAWIAAGGITSSIASELELGEVLAQHQLRPVHAGVLDAYKDAQAGNISIKVAAKVLFALVNEVRVLKGQSTITANQFRNYVKGLM